jgi:two-component system sensor histidine kinase KdpD
MMTSPVKASLASELRETSSASNVGSKPSVLGTKPSVLGSLRRLVARVAAALPNRERRPTPDMYTFTSRLTTATSSEDVARAIVGEVRSLLDRDAALFLVRGGELTLCDTVPDGAVPTLDEQFAIAAFWNGRGSTTQDGDRHTFVTVPTCREALGLLFVRARPGGPAEPHRRNEELRLLGTLANQAAMTLERVGLSEQVQDARVQAEAERLRAALLSAVSHDLKTPLASILGNISSVREYAHLYDAATRDEMLASAQTEAERLSRFVSNLLHMTRIDAGAVRPAFEMVDLSDVVGSAIKSAGRLLDSHWLRVDLDADLPMVRLDCVLIDHVLVNLLDNAAKYAPAGSLIRIGARRVDGCVRVEVEDEGPGIRPEDLPYVFDRFFRAGGDRQPSGTGLGLAICRSFLQSMKAQITVRNRSDRSGAVFSIEIPMTEATLREPEPLE